MIFKRKRISLMLLEKDHSPTRENIWNIALLIHLHCTYLDDPGVEWVDQVLPHRGELRLVVVAGGAFNEEDMY